MYGWNMEFGPGVRVSPSRVVCLIVVLLTATVAGTAQTQREPLSRDRAVQLFLDQNREIQAARFEADRTRADEIGAGLRPNPEVTFTAENFRLDGDTPFDRLYEVAATWTETIELGGKRRLRGAVADLAVDAAGARFDALLRDGVVDVERLYLEAVWARERADTALETSSLFSELLEDMEARFDEGAVSRGDLIRVRLEGVRIDRAVAETRLALDQAMIRLIQQLGESDFDRWVVADDLTATIVVPDLPVLREMALADHAGLRAARAEVERSEQAIALERAEGKADLRPFVGYKRVASSDTVLFGITLPLNFRDRNQDGVARAIADRGVAESRTALLENQILADVESAWRAYQSARERVSQFEDSLLDQADDAREIAFVSYEEGVGELLSLLDAQQVRTETRNAYDEALFDYGVSVLEIERAVGRDITP